MAEAAPREKPAFRRPPDAEAVAAAIKIILDHGTVPSQKRLRELVEAELRSHNPEYVVSETRLRHLLLRTGLVKVHIRVRMGGVTPTLAKCPVCGQKLARGTNKTLLGGNTQVGYRCSRCPWWTGREYRIPAFYTFSGRLEKAKKTGQTSFR
ncbi:MAG TPA: hypothetical protein VNZ52_13485 [Candidatus Thermoplasmatota archaeon]|nr:hypothetical protein [Candidatus Thermoplasmatota archaeon]